MSDASPVSGPVAGRAGGPDAGDKPSYGFSPAMVSMLNPSSPQAEAVRALRAFLMSGHVHAGRRALAVCAPSARVGCSFIAANLAVSVAQVGVKTLLIDADLRSPSIGGLIRPTRPAAGLAGALSQSEIPFSACVNDAVIPNLDILYSGGATDQDQDLLAGDRFRILMNYCLREYDFTIVDCPPANTSPDVRRISDTVGYSLIVGARDISFVSDIRTLADQLKSGHATVVGTVLNKT
jgi:capsular exopolysaccharide synthesis family protein